MNRHSQPFTPKPGDGSVPMIFEDLYLAIHKGSTRALASIADGTGKSDLCIMACAFDLGVKLTLFAVANLLYGYPLPPVLKLAVLDDHGDQDVHNKPV